MVQKLFQNGRFLPNYMRYVAETIEDVKKIRVTPASMGSEVYVIETGKNYVLDSKGVWHSKSSPDESIECDCIEESTIWEDLSSSIN